MTYSSDCITGSIFMSTWGHDSDQRYAARRRFVDEQREAQAKEFIEMAQPGGLGRGPDIDRINSLYEYGVSSTWSVHLCCCRDYKGRRQARLEAFIARQKEIDEMARG